jgi:formylglycine-generating enzyme required for sulfatase activity
MESANDVDGRCDVYSLAMTAIFSIHGKKLPSTALTNRVRFIKNLDCSRQLKTLLARGTHPDRDKRFETIAEFCSALRENLANVSGPAGAIPAFEITVAPGAAVGPPVVEKIPRQPGEIISNSIGMKLAWIPPGSFLMGSPASEAERSADEAQHRVTLTKGFFMGVYPVTQAQWRAVMGDNPSRFEGDDRPVEMVSWEDCQKFCRKLAAQEGKACRLPSEAEWEYACRAGTTTPFSFGETISTDQVNYDGNYPYGKGRKGKCRQETTPVGTFPANAWGLCDMHGNVWEWCQDRYGPYPQSDSTDPQESNNGEARVLRGGSWADFARHCRAGIRYRNPPADRYEYYGCRVALRLD